MTWVHRQASGAPAGSGTIRPQLVINDPTVSASQPMPDLAASAANALAHAIEGAVTGVASPVPTMAAIRAAVLLAEGLPEEGEPLLDPLALGALLSGYAIDANWYGIHHVMSQTLVRNAGVSHGDANAAMLPVTSAALRERRAEQIAAIDEATGVPAEELARRFARRAQAESLQAIGVDEAILPQLAEIASQRSELALTPRRQEPTSYSSFTAPPGSGEPAFSDAGGAGSADFDERDDRQNPDDRQADGPAVEVALNERAATERAFTGTDAEGARKTGILTGVHQDQEDHDYRKERHCCCEELCHRRRS